MKSNIYLPLILCLMIVKFSSPDVVGSESWYGQFNFDSKETKSVDSALTLDDVLKLVAAENPAFSSLSYQLIVAESNLQQAGLRPNPELATELEGFSWDSPGFRESELTVILSQEFEFFGQREARKNVARTGINATSLQIKQEAFDLYLDTKLRFYSLFHVQQKVLLSEASIALAKGIVGNITYRLERGAALHSELLLAQLEEQRVMLALAQAKQDLMAVEVTLVSLWNGKPSGLQLSVSAEPDYAPLLDQVTALSEHVDSTRSIAKIRNEEEILQTEKRLVVAEAKPTITLNGGFKRIEADNSNSFIFGFSLPLPLFNRNQGTRGSIDASLLSLGYEVERIKTVLQSGIQSQTIRIKQLIEKDATLDSLLLPTARHAYQTLQKAYEAGRVPYTQLLEAERFLNELNYEHNDILLEIQEHIISMEQFTGVALRLNKGN